MLYKNREKFMHTPSVPKRAPLTRINEHDATSQINRESEKTYFRKWNEDK